MAVIGTALVALLAGQGYASVYLSTLPHTGLDGTAYVAFWTINVNILLLVSHWILEEKVRSRALLFVIKYYYFLVYFIFYRNLFARLQSFDQFALIQLLSSFWICIWYPFSMTRWCHSLIEYFTKSNKSYEEHVESIGMCELSKFQSDSECVSSLLPRSFLSTQFGSEHYYACLSWLGLDLTLWTKQECVTVQLLVYAFAHSSGLQICIPSLPLPTTATLTITI